MLELLMILGMVFLLVWLVVGIMMIILMITYIRMLKGYPKNYQEAMAQMFGHEEEEV